MNDETLLASFENRTLPAEEWTHRAHVKVAYLYLRAHDFDDAVERVRRGIQAYNAHIGVPESPTSGYHETTTVAFLHLVKATITAYANDLPDTADAFYDAHPQLHTKYVLRLFYSPACRMLPQAKFEFTEPDLTALPRWG